MFFKSKTIDEACAHAQNLEGDQMKQQFSRAKHRKMQEHPKGGKKGKGKGKNIVVVAIDIQNPNKHCKHCNVDSHTQESCWKLQLELTPDWSKQHKKKTLLVVE